MIKRVLSFLLPIKIHQKKSVYSKNLEVTWNNGHLVLDSENTNYSFGSLQRVLKKGLKYIGYERIQNFQSILVLGVAGGSVIETLKKEVKFEDLSEEAQSELSNGKEEGEEECHIQA